MHSWNNNYAFAGHSFVTRNSNQTNRHSPPGGVGVDGWARDKRHTINHVDKYYAFPSHFCLNMCSAGNNYAHARTVDTRLFFSLPTKSLGTRLDNSPRGTYTISCNCIRLLIHSIFHSVIPFHIPLQWLEMPLCFIYTQSGLN